jgi:alpha-L-fucosidase 2
VAPDTNYNLALLRWGCATLVELCERFGLDDPLLPRWKDVLARLVDYPVNENGYMVGAGMAFEKGHRHYSHLLMAYPLYLVNVDQPGGREVIDRTLRHWMSFKDGKAGYTWTGSSSLASRWAMATARWNISTASSSSAWAG